MTHIFLDDKICNGYIMNIGTLLKTKNIHTVWKHAKQTSHAQTSIPRGRIVIFLGKHKKNEYKIFYNGKLLYDGTVNINNDYYKIC